MKKILIGCGGCLSALFLTGGMVMFLGSSLPREHTASSQIELSVTPEVVWPYISDLRGQVEWNDEISSITVTKTDEGLEVYEQETSFGAIPLVILESEEPSRFKTEIHGDAMGWGGTWTWTIEPTDAGSRVTIVEDGFAESGFTRFVSNYLMGEHAPMDGALKAIAVAAGDDLAEPTHVE